MAFWNVDLTTQDGAESAAGVGGFACFVSAALASIQFVLSAMQVMAAYRVMFPAAMVVTLAVAVAEIALYVAAGFRLRAGKGVILGAIVAVVLIVHLVLKIAVMTQISSALGLPSFVIGMVINVVLLVAVITGIRGAQAVKRSGFSADDAGQVFE